MLCFIAALAFVVGALDADRFFFSAFGGAALAGMGGWRIGSTGKKDNRKGSGQSKVNSVLDGHGGTPVEEALFWAKKTFVWVF